MNIRVCALKLWPLLLLHVTALNLIHPCSPQAGYSDPEENLREQKTWEEYFSRKYFIAHNETQIAMARAEADQGGATSGHGTHTPSSFLGSATFPDFPPSEDGCNFNSMVARVDLYFHGSTMWDGAVDTEWNACRYDDIEILAVDSCTMNRNIQLFGYNEFEIGSQRWDGKKADTLIGDNPSPNPLSHSFKVLVKLHVNNTSRQNRFGERDIEILADGVYFPATGKMHLAGCTRRHQILPDFDPPPVVEYAIEISPEQEQGYRYDPGSYHAPPLNSLPAEDCTISATVQYPPLLCRWNSERVLKYSIRSNREKDDPLYFEPVERSGFFPYLTGIAIQSQQRLETGGRILLLLLGLLCIAQQIAHGRKNEESLPFVSLVMLAIQLAHHFSQMSIFKDLQIGEYHSRGFPDSISEHNYYGTMAWSEHVPYQTMAMAAILMYVWIFLKVGDRRRIMELGVLRRRRGASDPPSDWRVMYATLAIFSFLGFLGFLAIRADHSGYGHWGRPLTGMTDVDTLNYNSYRESLNEYPAALPPYLEDAFSPFVSSRFYELSKAQWGFMNKLTGLVVSFFLVPQLLGNMEWDLQGWRPLSVWFYAGIPFLQSLPPLLSIAKHFQVLPIFPFYDPYMNSIYGIYEKQTPWWQVGVVLCSALLTLAVHSQFARSLRGPRHSAPKTANVQTDDMLSPGVP